MPLIEIYIDLHFITKLRVKADKEIISVPLFVLYFNSLKVFTFKGEMCVSDIRISASFRC